MKLINVIILSAVVLFSSCNDFLDEDMKEQKQSGEIVSVADANALVNQLYSSNISGFYTCEVYGGSREANGGYLMGIFDNPYKGQEEEVQNVSELTHNGSNISVWLEDAWAACYTGISRANNCIKYLPGTPSITDSELNRLMAQSKFFRAINYFYLVKMFGEVPIVKDPYESLDDIYVERSPIAEVYDLIIQDLTEALNEGNLNEGAQPLNGYRISKGTIRMLLSDVYLTMSGYPLQSDHYAEAAQVARDMINSGSYGLIANVDTADQSAYNIIRTSDQEKEYLFVKEFDAAISSSSWWPAICLPSDVVGYVSFSITNNAFKPTPLLLNAYDPVNDLRMQNKQFFHWTFDHDTTHIPIEVCPYRWYDESSLFGDAKGGKDVAIYRYAEALFIAAEAIANTEGVTDEAAGYLAQIEARASLLETEAEIKTRLMALSKDDFIKEVWAERFRELSLDFKSFFDVQRTRMFPSTSELMRGQVTFVPVNGATTGLGYTMDEHFLLYPLPNTEIQRNPSLTQNPGY